MRWLRAYYKLGVSHFLLSPRRRCTQRERHIPVTRLSASLLSSWLFPDKYSRPLDSTPLSSRIMANYQEAVCWKDAARNYICLQTALRFKHMLWKKHYLQRWNAFKRTKTAFKASCDRWEMPEPWLTWELGYFFFFFLNQKLFTRMELRNGWWKLVDSNDMWCVYNSMHSVLYLRLSLVQWFKIKRGIWPRNITMWRHTHKVKLEVASMNYTWRERSENRQQTLGFFLWHCLTPWIFALAKVKCGNWCGFSQGSRSLYLQSFQRASAKPKRNNFQKPTGVPTSFFCHCVSTNSSTYRPNTDLLLLQPGTRQCENQKKY